MEIRSDHSSAPYLRHLLVHANLPQQQFGIFLPSTFKSEAPHEYQQQLVSHHHHLQRLRLIVVYGLPITIKKCNNSQSCPETSTLYHHLCQVRSDTTASTSSVLFEHIEETKNTVEQGKWFFVTTYNTHHQAENFIDNQLPALCRQFLPKTDTTQSNSYHTTPTRIKKPSSTVRTYAAALLKAPSSERVTHSFNTTASKINAISPLPQQPPISKQSENISYANANFTTPDETSLPTSEKYNNSRSSQDEKSDFQKLQQQLNDVTTKLKKHEDILKAITLQTQVQQDLISQLKNPTEAAAVGSTFASISTT